MLRLLICLLTASLVGRSSASPQQAAAPAAVPATVPVGTPAPSTLAERTTAYLGAYAAEDWSRLAEWLAPEARFEDTVMELAGREQVVSGLRAAFAAMDIEALQLDERLFSGVRHSLSSGRVRFTQAGETVGLPGVTLRFELPMAISLRFDDAGLVLRHVDFIDSEAYTAQLGAQVRAAQAER